MMDLRLKEEPYVFDGHTYLLRCNMNVLADVQEAYGGNISAALRQSTSVRTINTFLTAMINDYADEMGWPSYTVKQVGRLLPTDSKSMTARTEMVMRLVTAAVAADRQTDSEQKN